MTNTPRTHSFKYAAPGAAYANNMRHRPGNCGAYAAPRMRHRLGSSENLRTYRRRRLLFPDGTIIFLLTGILFEIVFPG